MRLIVTRVEQLQLRKEIGTLEQFYWTNNRVNQDFYQKEVILATPNKTKTTIATVFSVRVGFVTFLYLTLFSGSTLLHSVKTIHPHLYDSCVCHHLSAEAVSCSNAHQCFFSLGDSCLVTSNFNPSAPIFSSLGIHTSNCWIIRPFLFHHLMHNS